MPEGLLSQALEPVVPAAAPERPGDGVASGVTAVLVTWGATVAGATAAAVGGLYLLAWLVGAAARWSAAGVLTMKTNMAASLLMAGVSLLLIEPRRTSSSRRAVGMVLAGAVFLVGALTVCEHIFNADFGIDQLLATEAPGAFATAQPNRVGPPGCMSLMLIGAALLARARRRRIASYFALATAAVVLLPAVGFIAGVVQFYGQRATGIAWLTVLALVLLSAGIHLAEGPAGVFGLVFRDDPGGRLLRRLLPAVALAPLIFQCLQRMGAHVGMYGHNTGVGLLLVGLVLFTSALLWQGALHLSTEAAHSREAETEARWRADLLDLVHDAILVWSRENGIEAWNQGAQELYGFTSRDATGRHPDALLHTETAQPLADIQEEVQRAGRWEGELRHRTKDGREVVVSSKFRLVRGLDGRERVLEVNRDITARMRMENELRLASRSKDEFLGLLSHELRNPLAPISNSLFILEHAEPAGQQAHRAMEVIGRQVGHLTRLVDDLLEVTRITRGKVQLRRMRIDVCELVRRTGEDHRDLLKKRGLDFTVETPRQPVWVDGDETRLAQVIGNLLHNAAKFTPTGGWVTLSAIPLDAAVEIHVADSGSGIAPAIIEHVFEPFVQAEQTLARTEGGLGLGLALVKGLAELHGGSAEARSGGEGRGSEFIVRLPTVLAPEPDRRQRVPLGVGSRTLRVLVVEDNADAADSLAEIVKMYGHEVQVAYNGPSALAMATRTVPDLVLCDIGLPGMDGYDVARALRSDPKLQAARLVAVTGYAQPEEVQRAVEAGFSGHIPKPPAPETLEQFLATTSR